MEDVIDRISATFCESLIEVLAFDVYRSYLGGSSFVARQRRGLRPIFASALQEPKTVLLVKFHRNRPSRFPCRCGKRFCSQT